MNKKLMRFVAPFLAGSVLLTSGVAAAAEDIPEYSPEKLQQAIAALEQLPQAPVVLTLTSALNVYIDNEVSVGLSNEYRIGEQVTLTAPEVAGKEFAGWEIETPNGDKVLASTKPDFTLALNADADAYAVYEDTAAAQKSIVSFTSVKPVTYAGKKVMSLTATRSIADSDNVSAAGFVYTNNKLFGAESTDNVLNTAKDDLISLLTDEAATDEATKIKVHEVEVTDNADGDWTLHLVPSAEDMRYYMMSYIIVNGEKIYSEPISLTYDSMENATSDMMNIATGQDTNNS